MTKGIISHQVIPFPDLESISSSFPPLDLQVPEMDWTGTNEGVSRRIVFDSAKISMLKVKAASKEVPQPTRVEAVTALLWKSAMAAAASSRGGLKKQSALLQWVNLRKRMNPPLPESSTGNLISCFAAKTSLDWETELQGLVKQLRKAMREFSGDFLTKLQESNINAVSAMHDYVNEVESLSKDDEVDVYNCSSWCRMELYESADFGWGKPGWVSGLYKLITRPKSFLLMESTDGTEGIEAWVYLSEAEMYFFECNRDLLAFASMNPSVNGFIYS
ncbi:Transferase [Corchorus capsularis]|uniref:Transferase n=1 Tax=Corchorus capsularis TaxID=210143 RepID=A0A1R3KDF2_COCAP|nr:Transferase [Corchorus capsularis]